MGALAPIVIIKIHYDLGIIIGRVYGMYGVPPPPPPETIIDLKYTIVYHPYRHE